MCLCAKQIVLMKRCRSLFKEYLIYWKKIERVNLLSLPMEKINCPVNKNKLITDFFVHKTKEHFCLHLLCQPSCFYFGNVKVSDEIIRGGFPSKSNAIKDWSLISFSSGKKKYPGRLKNKGRDMAEIEAERKGKPNYEGMAGGNKY